MKKFIKFLSLTLTFLLTFSFIGCNKNAPSEDETSNISVYLTSSETIIDSENGTVSKTITATVYPEDAPNKLVDWSIDWDVNNIGDDAIISDYITITPLEDGSNVATVTCYQGFEGSSFMIYAKTRIGQYTATCLVTYDGAPEKFYFIYNDVEYSNLTSKITLSAGETYNFDLLLSNTLGAVGSKYCQYEITSLGCQGRFIANQIEYLNGTIISTEEIVIDLASGTVGNYSFSLNNFANITLNNNVLSIEAIKNEKSFNLPAGAHVRTGYAYKYKSAYVDPRSPLEEDCFFNVVITEKISGKQIVFNFDIESVVTNVTLDNSELVF
ncbi:MAG: hypothetical protein IJW26_00745 [Clostridia bacterium]|nr:hypothetical protein [Clostridia bacterium]